MVKFIISISFLGRVPDFLLTYAGLHPFSGPNIILSDSLLIKAVVFFLSQTRELPKGVQKTWQTPVCDDKSLLAF